MGNKEKQSITPSKVDSYFRCGESFRRRYIEKEVIPPGIAASKGTSIHKASETNFLQKMASHNDLKESDIVDCAISTFEGIVKNEGVFLNAEQESVGKKKTIAEAKDSIGPMGAIYVHRIAPRYQPKEVEITQEIEFESANYFLRGRLDLVDDKGQIVDLKTSGKTKTQDEIDKSSQLTFYDLTYRANKGEAPGGIVIENIVDLKSGPKVVTLNTTRDKEDSQILVNRINTMIKGVEAGVFLPAAPGSWICSAKFCGYAPTCKFFKQT